jgi:hypothetical protein
MINETCNPATYVEESITRKCFCFVFFVKKQKNQKASIIQFNFSVQDFMSHSLTLLIAACKIMSKKREEK